MKRDLESVVGPERAVNCGSSPRSSTSGVAKHPADKRDLAIGLLRVHPLLCSLLPGPAQCPCARNPDSPIGTWMFSPSSPTSTRHAWAMTRSTRSCGVQSAIEAWMARRISSGDHMARCGGNWGSFSSHTSKYSAAGFVLGSSVKRGFSGTAAHTAASGSRGGRSSKSVR
jgi:hypothetical protein